MFACLYISVGEFGHPFEENSAYYESDVDSDDAFNQLGALSLINSVKDAHWFRNLNDYATIEVA